MHYQITINFAEGVTLDTVALAKAVIDNAISAKIGGGKVAEIYVSDITELTPKNRQ